MWCRSKFCFLFVEEGVFEMHQDQLRGDTFSSFIWTFTDASDTHEGALSYGWHGWHVLQYPCISATPSSMEESYEVYIDINCDYESMDERRDNSSVSLLTSVLAVSAHYWGFHAVHAAIM
jgi:hypothetical protein